MFKFLKILITFAFFLILITIIIGYFFYFIPIIYKTYDLPKNVEGIAVLTGGKGRIEKALSIFNNYPKSKLIISGVHKKVSLNNIISSSNYNKNGIFIDKQSESTLQNAIAIVRWANERSLTHILIITSYYHMPRSMLLLNYFGKDINFYSIPVLQRSKSKYNFKKKYFFI